MMLLCCLIWSITLASLASGSSSCRLPYQLYNKVVGFHTSRKGTGYSEDTAVNTDSSSSGPSSRTHYGLDNDFDFQKPTNHQLDYWQHSQNGRDKNIGTDGYSRYSPRNLAELKYGDYIIVDCSDSVRSVSGDRNFGNNGRVHNVPTSSASWGLKAFKCKGGYDSMLRMNCYYSGDRFTGQGVNILVPHLQTLRQGIRTCAGFYRGATLATIRSNEENSLLEKTMKIRKHSSQTDTPDCAFIGFTDRAREGTWRWMNGEKVTYTNWHSDSRYGELDQPNNGYNQGEEDYSASCKTSTGSFAWYDVGPPRATNPGLSGQFNNQGWAYCTIPWISIGGDSSDRRQCLQPNIPNGYSYPTGPIQSGTSVSIFCYPGFSTLGSTKLACLNGQLSWPSDRICYPDLKCLGLGCIGSGYDHINGESLDNPTVRG